MRREWLLLIGLAIGAVGLTTWAWIVDKDRAERFSQRTGVPGAVTEREAREYYTAKLLGRDLEHVETVVRGFDSREYLLVPTAGRTELVGIRYKFQREPRPPLVFTVLFFEQRVGTVEYDDRYVSDARSLDRQEFDSRLRAQPEEARDDHP
jgi:hypothetical protein